MAALDLDWVALRPVLVYGPGAKGNMGKLVELARLPVPLPFGSLNGTRSLLALDNLTDAIVTVLTTPSPLRRRLLVADPSPVTLPEIIAALRSGLGRRHGLLSMPVSWLRAGLNLAGRLDIYDRLAGSLVVDTSALQHLGWAPRVATHEGLAALIRGTAG